jgi:chromosome segregation ATPase
MLLLNIFYQSDGTFAWDNSAILLLALIAGYLLHRFTLNKTAERKYSSGISNAEKKYKLLENEFKSFKSSTLASEKHGEKSLTELTSRVKALEGDIRALSEEKNKLLQQLQSKEIDIRNYSKQVTELDDNLKAIKESSVKADAAWSHRLQIIQDELSKAKAWESRVRSAEDEAQKARSAVHLAERKSLEMELRLKSTTGYAGRVAPLEYELDLLKSKHASLENELTSLRAGAVQSGAVPAVPQNELELADDSLAKLKMVSAQLELQKDSNQILQHEFEMKQANNMSLKAEIDRLRDDLKKMIAAHEGKTGQLNTSDIQ